MQHFIIESSIVQGVNESLAKFGRAENEYMEYNIFDGKFKYIE